MSRLDGGDGHRPAKQTLLGGLTVPEKAFIALVALTALASQLWHPLILGFYHDDWWLFASPRTRRGALGLGWAFAAHADRPGYALLNYGLLWIWNGAPWLLHLYKVGLNLASAFLIFVTALRVQELFRTPSPAVAACAAAFWLLAPWGAGYTIWPTAAFTNLVVIATCISALCLMAWWRNGRGIFLVGAALAFAAGVFTYQSGWGAVFPFLIALALSDELTGRNPRRLLLAGGTLLTVQGAALALALWKSPKKIALNPFVPIAEFPSRLYGVLSEHFGPSIIPYLSHAAVALLVLVLVESRHRPQDLRRVAVGTAMLIAGIAMTAVLYGSAGYALSPTGTMSRTSQFVNFWLATAFAVLVAAPARRPWLRHLGTFCGAAMLALAAYFYVPVAKRWSTSWELQKAVLAKAHGLVSCLRNGDVVLQNAPMEHEGVEVFGAPWDIGAALFATHRAAFKAVEEFLFLPSYPWRMSLQPGSFSYGPGRYSWVMAWNRGVFTVGPGWVWPRTDRVIVWNVSTDRMRIVEEAAVFPPNERAELFASAADPISCERR